MFILTTVWLIVVKRCVVNHWYYAFVKLWSHVLPPLTPTAHTPAQAARPQTSTQTWSNTNTKTLLHTKHALALLQIPSKICRNISSVIGHYMATDMRSSHGLGLREGNYMLQIGQLPVFFGIYVPVYIIDIWLIYKP